MKPVDEPVLFKVFEVSTAHVMPLTDMRLKADPPGACADTAETGWWVLACSDDDHLAEVGRKYGECLSKILSVALALGCRWVYLHGDGPVYDFLPAYEWK